MPLPFPLFASVELPLFPLAAAFGSAVALGCPRVVGFEEFAWEPAVVLLARFAPAIRLPFFGFAAGFVAVFVASTFGADVWAGAVWVGAVCVGAEGALCS